MADSMLKNDNMITIDTRDFGRIKISENTVITFPNGLYAFDDYKKFALICPHEDGVSYPMWLQSLDDAELCFIVFNPMEIMPDYKYLLTKSERELIKLTGESLVQCLCISVINDDITKATVNLKCPIIVNSEQSLALQLILIDSGYDYRHPLFKEVEGVKC